MRIYQALIVALVALAAVGCGGAADAPRAASPIEVLKVYIEASDRKDLAAVKQTFSRGTVKMYEEAAQKRGMSVDEVVKDQFEAASSTELKSKLEPGKETITGDAATVEVKDNSTGNLEKIPFVKEDGAWKIAFDKFMEDLMNKMREQLKAPAPNLAKPGGDGKQPVNKPKTNK